MTVTKNTIDDIFVGKLFVTYKDIREFFQEEVKNVDEPVKEYIYNIMPVVKEIEDDGVHRERKRKLSEV